MVASPGLAGGDPAGVHRLRIRRQHHNRSSHRDPAVVPQVQESFVSQLDEALRKTGHFAGYRILSALVFFALKNTNYDRVRSVLRRTWGSCLHDLWRWEWVLLGMLVTVVTATFDEVHQTFFPSRTGR